MKPSMKGKLTDFDTKPTRVCYITDSFNLSTGYSKCVLEICNRLGKDLNYNVVTIGKWFNGKPIKPEGLNFEIHPYKDQNGTLLLQIQIQSIKPDFAILQDDSFVTVGDGVDKVDFGNTKLIYYVASDGNTLPTTAPQILNKADILIAMTKWHKKQLEKEGYEVRDYIYHGVDLKKYSPPIPEIKQHIREGLSMYLSKIWDKPIDLRNKFVVFAMGRNSLRKAFQSLILAFSKFQKDKDDVVLLMHASNYQAGDLNLQEFINRCVPLVYGPKYKDLLWNKIVFSPAQSLFLGIPEEQVVQLYQASDVYASSAIGEGFGLGTIEAEACGLPVIAPDNTSHSELVVEKRKDKKKKDIGKRGSLFKTKMEHFASFNVSHSHPDPDDMANVLEKYYKDWKNNKSKMIKEQGQNGRRFVEAHCDWDAITEKWKKIMKKETENKPIITQLQ